MLPILGGPGGVLALNYTHQFAEDHARVRKLLLERYEEWIASPDLYAMPIELAEHLKLDEDCSTAQMHAALVVATRAVAMKFSIVGGPIVIGTEPSGEKSKPWVDGQEAWHASFLTCLDYSSYCGIDDNLFQRQLVAEGDRWGLLAKMTCDDHETSLPGLKLLINTPASLLALIKYLLKCLLAGKKCCIVAALSSTLASRAMASSCGCGCSRPSVASLSRSSPPSRTHVSETGRSPSACARLRSS